MSSQVIPHLRIQQLQRSSKGGPWSHLSAVGPKGFDSLSFLAALSSYPSLNIVPVSTPPSHVDIPSQEEKVSYMAQHASTEGKFSACFFMGVLLIAEVPNASILTILNIQFMMIFLSPGHWVVYTWL